MTDPDVKYPEIPDGEEPDSMYWDDNEDSTGYKEDGKSNYFNE